MRLFKLESGQKGSHIHFREFEILLFKMAKVLHSQSVLTPEKKYFKLVQSILKQKPHSLERENQLQRRPKVPQNRRKRPKRASDSNLPEIVAMPMV